MSNKKITFTELREKKGDSGVREIALEYSRGADSVTLEYLAKEHNMSKYSIRQLLDFAIVECVVSYQDAVLMREKAHRNQLRQLDSSKAITKSDKYYAMLFKSRLESIKRCKDEKVKVLVDLYLTSPLLSAKKIARSQGLSPKELSIILKKSIVFNIIDDNTTRELVNYTTAKAHEPRRLGVWVTLNELMATRKEYQLASAQVDEIDNKLEEFPGYYFEEEGNSFEFQKLKLETEKAIAQKHLDDVFYKAYCLLDE